MKHVDSKPGTDLNNSSIQHQSFAEFLKALKAKMKLVYYDRANNDQLSIKRGLPPFVM